MRSNELWSVDENHATVKPVSIVSSWNENLQRMQNWTAKSTNLKESAGKVKSVFVNGAAQWAEKLRRSLNVVEVEKMLSESLWLQST